MSFGLVFLLLNTLQIVVVTAILLAMYWPLGIVVMLSIVPVTFTVLHFQREYTRLSRLAQDQSGPRRHPRRGVRARRAGDQVVRTRALRLRPVRRAAYRAVRHSGEQGLGFGEVLDAARGHPEPDADHRAGSWRLRGRPRLCHDGHARRVHHDDAVAGVADRVAGLPAVDDAGVVHRSQPDRRDLRCAKRISPTARREDTPRGGRLELDDVGFRFPDRGRTAAGHCGTSTCVVEPGETVALVGSTGSGKSVLAALLSRLYDVTEGAIRIDGDDIRDLSLSALRETVATAFEDPTLFSMSVAENLRLGRPHATDERARTGHRRRGRAVRLRIAVRPRHPHRRAGHEPVRRSAPTAFAGPGDPGRAEDPGARRHAFGARRAHRSRRRGGVAPSAAFGDRHRRRQPRVDRAAGRQGRPARATAPSPTSARTPNCWPPCRGTATCWPPTTNATTPNAAARGRRTRTVIGCCRTARSRTPSGTRGCRPTETGVAS